MIRWARRAAVLLVLASASCSPKYAQVRVEEPAGARVVFAQGLHTPERKTTTPFTGRFEAVTLAEADAYDLTFELDAPAAARYGVSGAVKLYGKLAVAEPTKLGESQTLVLRMDPEKIAELVKGTRSEIEVFVEDPNTSTPTELARLILRMGPW